jgi:hypothetical protein
MGGNETTALKSKIYRTISATFTVLEESESAHCFHYLLTNSRTKQLEKNEKSELLDSSNQNTENSPVVQSLCRSDDFSGVLLMMTHSGSSALRIFKCKRGYYG